MTYQTLSTSKERRPLSDFRQRHSGEDIWVVASASSMDYVQPEFFANKIVIGVNDVYRRFPCTYLVRKEGSGAEEASAAGIPLIISEYDCGNRGGGRNSVPGVAWYYDHPQNECSAMDLSVIGTERILVSFSTITSAIHIAAYMGAANIMICGHDGGALDGRMTYSGYYPDDPGYTTWYRSWVSQIMGQTRDLRDKLQQVYGCRIHSLNPFIGFDLEGHHFSTSPNAEDQQESQNSFHAYWTNPPTENRPEAYRDAVKRSELIVDRIQKYCGDRESRILELGCGVGRTLKQLQAAGYRQLTGVDLNRHALEIGQQEFPDLRAHLICDLVEDFVSRQVSPFDVVFTLSVLNHLPPSSDAVISQLARLTKKLIIVLEDEQSSSSRHVPRNYRDIFVKQGMIELESIQFDENGGDYDLNANFFLRVFSKSNDVG